jgi:hypothetical protein
MDKEGAADTNFITVLKTQKKRRVSPCKTKVTFRHLAQEHIYRVSLQCLDKLEEWVSNTKRRKKFISLYFHK